MRKSSFVLVILAAALFVSPLFAADLMARHDVSASVRQSNLRRLILEIPAAEVNLHNSFDGSFSVTGTVARDYRNAKQLEMQQKIVDGIDVVLKPRGTAVVVERKFGRNAVSRTARSHKTKYTLDISVPEGTAVEIRQGAGDVRAEGTFGDLYVDVNMGNVKVKVPKRSIREVSANSRIGEVNTNLGDRIVTKEGLFAGATHYLNEGGVSMLEVAVRVGDVDIDLR